VSQLGTSTTQIIYQHICLDCNIKLKLKLDDTQHFDTSLPSNKRLIKKYAKEARAKLDLLSFDAFEKLAEMVAEAIDEENDTTNEDEGGNKDDDGNGKSDKIQAWNLKFKRIKVDGSNNVGSNSNGNGK
jgi:hypothetical protein